MKKKLLPLVVVLVPLVWSGCSTTPSSSSPNPIDASVTDASTPDPTDGGGGATTEIAPMIVVDFGVFLQITLDGKGPFLLRYDTGSPTTYLDKAHANKSGISSSGVHEAKVGNVLLGSERLVTLIDWLEAGITYPGLPGPILGLAGNDLFAGTAVGLNYRDAELWIVRSARAPTNSMPMPIPTPKGVGSQVSADFRLMKGYVTVSCSFDGGAPEHPCLFDTGAVHSFALEQHWSSFSHADDAHRVPSISRDNQGTVLEGYYQRATAVRLGDLSVRGDVVSVLSKFDLVTSVGQSVGLNLVGMVGMTTTLGHYTIIDYPNQRLHLFAYEPKPSLFTSPFIGFGFTVGAGTNNSLVVSALVPGSDAASPAKGVQKDDKLVRVDGVPLASSMLSYTITSLIAGPAGQHRSFEFERAGVMLPVVDLIASDLLPPLP